MREAQHSGRETKRRGATAVSAPRLRTAAGSFVAARCAAALALAAVLFVTAGCASSPEEEKYYYTLRYDPVGEKPELIQSDPLDISVWVRGATISRTYKRKQIVLRHFGPRISYLDNHLWANELEDKIPELVTKRLDAYNLFRTIRQDFPYSRPDYELVTNITALEFIRGAGTEKAAIHIRFQLRELQGSSVVSRDIEREIPVYDRSLDSFVQVVNEAVLEYIDLFAREILSSFGRGTPRVDAEGLKLERTEAGEETGSGELLMPGIFTGRDQPVYTVIDDDGDERLGRFGTPLELPAGRYTVRYGSGSLKRQMQRRVRIREGYRTIAEPDYGGLRVEVITPDGRPVELPYEIFDAGSGDSYGTGYAVEEIGEWEEEIWVLPAGRYKVTLNNQPFTTNRDYAAAYVKSGEGNILTITVEEIEETDQYRVVGGGVIKEPLYTEADEHWILASSIAGNVAGTLNNRESVDDYSTGFTLNGFLQNRLRYDRDPFDLTLLNLVEVGATRSEAGSFEITRDALEFDSTLVMNMLFNLGLYLNLDLSTHFLPSYYRSVDPFDYEKLDPEGNTIGSGTGVEEVKTAPPFFPLEFQEGAGLNLTIAEKPRLESSARFGLGLRQNIYGSAFPVTDTSADPVQLQRKRNEFTTGLEASLLFSTRFLQDVTYNTRFEAYAPFTDLEDLSLEWSHDLQLSLLRGFTIDYRATIYNTLSPAGNTYIGSDHALYLRFSTMYRLSF